METKEAIEILKKHNAWRRFNSDIEQIPQMVNPKKLGIAIDTVVSELESLLDKFTQGMEYTPKCATQDKHGNHCPEKPTKKVGGLDVCDKCYEYWKDLPKVN